MKFFSKDFIDVILKTGLYIRKIKKHDRVLKVAIFDTKNCLLFIIFLDSYLMTGINEVDLGKSLGSIKSV